MVKLKDDENGPRVLVTTIRVDKIPSETYVFKNYSTKQSGMKIVDKCFIWEAARCTSAAPTYWRPYTREIDLLLYFIDDKILENDYQNYTKLYNIIKKSYGTELEKTNASITKVGDIVAKTEAMLYNPLLIKEFEKQQKDLYNREKNINDLVYAYNKKIALESLISDGCIINEQNECDISIQRSIQKFKLKNAWVMVDGGFGTNNPILLGYADAISLNYNIGYCLSIGTGETEHFLNDNFLFSKFRESNFIAREKDSILLRIAVAVQRALTNLYEMLGIIMDNKGIEKDRDNIILQIDRLNKKILAESSEESKKRLIQEKQTLEILAKNLSSYANKNSLIATILGVINDKEEIGSDVITAITNNFGAPNFGAVLPEEIAKIPEGLINKLRTVTQTITSMPLYYEYFRTISFIIMFITNKITITALNKNLRDILTNIRGKQLLLEGVLISIISALSELEKEAVFNNVNFEEFKKIFQQDIMKQKNMMIDQVKLFAETNLIGTVTGTYEANKIMTTLLPNSFKRINPTYSQKIDLAETNPIKIWNMMKNVNEYIEKDATSFQNIADDIYELTKDKEGTKYMENKNDEQLQIGIFIQRCIQYERERLHNLLNINLEDSRTYYFLSDIIYLDNIIDFFYRIYYEAYYAFLLSLQKYNTSKILTSENVVCELKYMDMLTYTIVAKKYTLIEILNILNGIYHMKGNMGGGSLGILKILKIIRKKEEDYSTIENLIKYKALLEKNDYENGKNNIDDMIMSYMVKRSDKGIKCDICSISAGEMEITHYCTLFDKMFNAENDKSNTYNYWNTCRQLSPYFKNTYLDVDPETNRAIQHIDNKINSDFVQIYGNVHNLFIDSTNINATLFSIDPKGKQTQLKICKEWIKQPGILEKLSNQFDPKNPEKFITIAYKLFNESQKTQTQIDICNASFGDLKTIKIECAHDKYKYIYDITLFVNGETLVNVGECIKNGMIRFASCGTNYNTATLFAALHILMNLVDKYSSSSGFAASILKFMNLGSDEITKIGKDTINTINTISTSKIYMGFIIHNILLVQNIPTFYVVVDNNVVNNNLVKDKNFSSYCSIMTGDAIINQKTLTNINFIYDVANVTKSYPNLYPVRRKKFLLEMMGFIYYSIGSDIFYEKDYTIGKSEIPMEYYDLEQYGTIPIEYYSHLRIKSIYLNHDFSGTFYALPYIYYQYEKYNIFDEQKFFELGVGIFESEYIISNNSLVIITFLNPLVDIVKNYRKKNMQEDVKQMVNNKMSSVATDIQFLNGKNNELQKNKNENDSMLEKKNNYLSIRKNDIIQLKDKITHINVELDDLKNNYHDMVEEKNTMENDLLDLYVKNFDIRTKSIARDIVKKYINNPSTDAKFSFMKKYIADINEIGEKIKDYFDKIRNKTNNLLGEQKRLMDYEGEVNNIQQEIKLLTDRLEKNKSDISDLNDTLSHFESNLAMYANYKANLEDMVAKYTDIFKEISSSAEIKRIINSSDYILMGYKLYFSLTNKIGKDNTFNYVGMPIPVFDSLDNDRAVYKIYT